MLDEFSATSIAASGPGRPSDPTKASSAALPDSTAAKSPAPSDDAPDSAEFSAQLQKEMAALLGEIDESPEMRQQLDELVGELTAGAERALQEDDEKKKGISTTSDSTAPPATHSAPNPSTAAPSEPEPNFTDTIRRTMERMAASSSSASAAAAAEGGGAAAGSEEDILAQLMKEMGGGEGGASEEEFSKMLLGMMEQLTNKEILYEPMKELDGKFPKWIEEHEGKVEKEEMDKYKEQQGLVREIVGRFESKGYSDQNPQDREFVVERMQKVSPWWHVAVFPMMLIEAADAGCWESAGGLSRGHGRRTGDIRGTRTGLSATIMKNIPIWS